MSVKKFPPGWTETGRNGGGYESPCDGVDYITNAGETQARILSLLHSGAKNALTLRDIRGQTGFDGRRVRRAIREARLRGVPVISDCEHGYWLSDVPAEIRHCAHSLRRRARETEVAADALSAVADALEKAVET